MDASIVGHQNRTGLSPGHAEYYSYERKAAVPRMLYRGHAVRISRGGEDDYYQQHVVRRYQMHALNAGFSGKETIPLKDRNNYKVPSRRIYCPSTPCGKWANYPMTVEIGRYTRGFGGKYFPKPVPPAVREIPQTPAPPPRARSNYSFRGSVDMPSRPLPSPLDNYMDARLYEELEPEIIDIMAARNEVFLSFQNRVESALMNDNDRASRMASNPVSRLGFSTTTEPIASIRINKPRPKTTSFFVEDPNSKLLLPVPFVMPNNRLQRIPNKQRSLSAPVVGIQLPLS